MESPPLPSVFLDSSVFFAALHSASGASRAVIVLAELQLLRRVVCPQIFDEVEHNLAQKAPAALPHFQRLRANLDWEIVSDPSPEQVRIYLNIIAAKDAPILVAAITAQPQRMVTLDKRHFDRPAVRQAVSFLIQTPAELISDIRRTIIQHLGSASS